ncbi:hypothetical protein [Microcoleus sp. F4-D5]|uniref:hypothetical protein n=1 Tax=Microcoleus sp. F4-D5 TaxID=2818760 RepID=UPI002FD0EE94
MGNALWIIAIIMFGYTNLKTSCDSPQSNANIKSRLAADTAMPFPYIIGIMSLGIR